MLNNVNFVEWFGNSELLTSDPLGTPIVFYHKSRSKDIFHEFKLEGEQIKKNPYNNDYGIFFVQKKDKKSVDYIGDGIDIYAYLRMEKPFLIWVNENGAIDILGNKHEPLYIPKSLVDKVCELGYDGIIIADDRHYSQYVVFNPNQIKSIDNNGNFSRTSNNIFE